MRNTGCTSQPHTADRLCLPDYREKDGNAKLSFWAIPSTSLSIKDQKVCVVSKNIYETRMKSVCGFCVEFFNVDELNQMQENVSCILIYYQYNVR